MNPITEAKRKKLALLLLISGLITGLLGIFAARSTLFAVFFLVSLTITIFIYAQQRRQFSRFLSALPMAVLYNTGREESSRVLQSLLVKGNFHDVTLSFFYHPDRNKYSQYISRISAKLGTQNESYHITACTGTLPMSLSGWLLLVRKGSKFYPRDDIRLESVEFNKETYLAASSKETAYALLAPDFMAWYLDQQDRPWLYIEGNTFVVAVPEQIQEEAFDTFLARFSVVAKFFEKSGGLQNEDGIGENKG